MWGGEGEESDGGKGRRVGRGGEAGGEGEREGSEGGEEEWVS